MHLFNRKESKGLREERKEHYIHFDINKSEFIPLICYKLALFNFTLRSLRILC